VSVWGSQSCGNCNRRPVCLVATTAERFFRIDRALEVAHYVTDIASHDLFIVDPDLQTCFVAPTIIYGSDGDDGSQWLHAASPPAELLVNAAANSADHIHYRQ